MKYMPFAWKLSTGERDETAYILTSAKSSNGLVLGIVAPGSGLLAVLPSVPRFNTE
ncbi:MAG: hypothetical protein LC749_15965 [Actinobacteria bacterium]|nr:hypothetical protein [Actinomycetota bacterium]